MKRQSLKTKHSDALWECSNKPVLITGGTGFIGTNLADRLLSVGQPVLLFDNLSRPGVEKNLRWLRETHGDLLRLQIGDIRDFGALQKVVKNVSKVFHLSAQVAVTTSLVNPLFDFEVNARGTLNLLEALREVKEPVPLIFTSTNKVYGDLNHISIRREGATYQPVDARYRNFGFGETQALSFHSPYGCSKGAASQYVLDYARTFDFPAMVFTMSCIYGPHQFGNEDQGWVAHFLIRGLQNLPITLYGDGCQVRDLLYVTDLVDAFFLAMQNMEKLKGHVFNIGGGPQNTISLLGLLAALTKLQNQKPQISFDQWRTADQRYYVSDTRKFSEATGWKPHVSVGEGIQRLYDWLIETRELAYLMSDPASATCGALAEAERTARAESHKACSSSAEPERESTPAPSFSHENI